MSWLTGRKATTRVAGLAIVQSGKKVRATASTIKGSKLGKAASQTRRAKRESN